MNSNVREFIHETVKLAGLTITQGTSRNGSQKQKLYTTNQYERVTENVSHVYLCCAVRVEALRDKVQKREANGIRVPKAMSRRICVLEGRMHELNVEALALNGKFMHATEELTPREMEAWEVAVSDRKLFKKI